MARQKGSANLSATIEVLAGGALDARTVVPTEADLLVANNFPYPYVGLPVAVQATGDMFVLMDMDVTNTDHWHKIGSGGSGNIVEGYYNETDGKFYEEDTYTTEIVGADDTLYISLDTNIIYRFDGTDFVAMSSPSNTVSLTQAEFDALPQSEKDDGTVYFITDGSAMQGVCVMGNRFDKANIYTEDERMVGSYLGKPLYQKTFDLGSEITISNISMTPTSISVNSLGCDKIISADGVRDDGLRTSFTAVCSSPYVELLAMRDGSGISTRYLTLQYTKTTDATVNIGTGNDYSTDEQIIGTWTDGKKLYQKTWTGLSVQPAYNSWTSVVEMPANADIPVDFELLHSASACCTGGGYEVAFIDGYVKCEALQNTNLRTIHTLTLRYTKTTD